MILQNICDFKKKCLRRCLNPEAVPVFLILCSLGNLKKGRKLKVGNKSHIWKISMLCTFFSETLIVASSNNDIALKNKIIAKSKITKSIAADVS